jgi:hypothetical protein
MSDMPAEAMTTATSADGAGTRDWARCKRRNVARRLPAEVKRAVESAVREAPSLSEATIAGIDERFELCRRYAISRCGLARFLRRLRDPDVPSARKVAAQHRRQESNAVLLNETLGPFAKSHPELWDQRAYLMLIGILYERLATNEKEISTDELVALSRMLVENRRVEARLRDGRTDAASPETCGSGELPEQFEDIVRRVYGTNFRDPGEGNVEAAKGPE